MKYDFDKIIDRHGTNSSKWDCGKEAVKRGFTTRFDEDTIPMFTADMDFLCAPAITEALHRAVDQGIFGYTSIVDEAYYTAIQDWFHQYNSWNIRKEQIVFERGTINALLEVIKIFTDEKDGIILMPPVYSGLRSAVEYQGRTAEECRLQKTDETYGLDFESLEKLAQDSRNKVVLLCNPHNPVGRAWTVGELERIVEICRTNHLQIWSDDVHCDLMRKGKSYIPVASVSDYERIITFTSLSKTFNLSGLYITNVIFGSEEMKNRYLEKNSSNGPSPFDIAAVKAAYTKCGEWLDALRAYLDGNIEWAAQYLEDNIPGLTCTRPEGSYILWIDFEGCGRSEEEIQHLILEKANVVLSKGKTTDLEGGRFCYRACVGTSRNVLEKAMKRIAEAFSL